MSWNDCITSPVVFYIMLVFIIILIVHAVSLFNVLTKFGNRCKPASGLYGTDSSKSYLYCDS
jgi:hypothetical protein